MPNNSTWYGGNEGTFASADGVTATFSGNWGMAAWKWAGGMSSSSGLVGYDINFTMNSSGGTGYFGLSTYRPIYPHWPIQGAGGQLGLSQNAAGAVVFPNENAGTRGTVASTTTWNLKFNMADNTMTLTGGGLSLTASATSVIDKGDLWIAFGREGCQISNFSVIAIVDPAACDMLSMQWGSYTGIITGTDVSLTVPYGTSLSALNPTYTTSYNATGLPASGSAPDFTGGPVDYTITSPDTLQSKTYKVTVTVAAPSTACDLLAMSVNGVYGAIDGTNVILSVPPGTPVTSLTPVCSISPLASVAPAAGIAQDFTSPVEYTVTAQNGSTHKHYLVWVFPSLMTAGFPAAPNGVSWFGGNEGSFTSADGITANFTGNWPMAQWKWTGGITAGSTYPIDFTANMLDSSAVLYFGLANTLQSYPHLYGTQGVTLTPTGMRVKLRAYSL